MTKPRLLLSVLALLLSSPTHAQSSCPWLTEGTAAAMLEGAVTTTIKVLPSNEGTCTFALQQEAAASILEITVSSIDHPTCPANSKPLSGIGNEAVICSPTETTDIVDSRVRNLYFTVRLTLTGKPASSPAQRQSTLQQVAEEVAGSLF